MVWPQLWRAARPGRRRGFALDGRDNKHTIIRITITIIIIITITIIIIIKIIYDRYYYYYYYH